MNYAQSFTVAGTFALVVPQESLAEGYGIFLSDNLLNNSGTETVGLEVIETPGGPGVELTQQNFQTGTIQVLGVAPINSSLLNSANQIELNFTYSASSGASLSAPQAEPVVATYQLLDNGTPVGTAQTVGSGTIFTSAENFTRTGFFGQAPAVSDSILQGVYGTLDLAQGGGWTYELNATGSQYQALDLGQTATDPFTVKVANSAGAATQTVTIDVTGIGAGTLASVAENTPNPTGESIAAIFTNNNVQNTTSSLTGVAISQNPGGTTGVWEYSTDNGTTWIDIPTSVSATSALVLATNDLIRFVPATNYSGSVTPLNVYGLDSAYTGHFRSNVNVATLLTSNPSDFVDPSTVAINTAILATPVAQWINASGGSWTSTANAGADWSTGSVPISTDDVVIALSGSAAYTVTITSGASASATSLTVNSPNAILLDQGTLTLTGTLMVSSGIFDLANGGSVSGGTLQATGGSFAWNGGTLSGVTYDGTMNLSSSSSSVIVANGLTMFGVGGTGSGAINLTGQSSILYAEGTETLNNATLNIGNNSTDYLYNYDNSAAAVLTLGPTLTIDQTGSNANLSGYFDRSGSGIVNDGTINADFTGGTFAVGDIYRVISTAAAAASSTTGRSTPTSPAAHSPLVM